MGGEVVRVVGWLVGWLVGSGLWGLLSGVGPHAGRENENGSSCELGMGPCDHVFGDEMVTRDCVVEMELETESESHVGPSLMFFFWGVMQDNDLL